MSDAVNTQSELQQLKLTIAKPKDRPRYKSWRKKYRKLRARFETAMKHNGNFFRDEQKLEALAKRLQEQNDQILDLLLDLNSSLLIPGDQTYNIKYRDDPADRLRPSRKAANDFLNDAYEAEQQGRLSQSQFWQMKASTEYHVAAIEAGEELASLEHRLPQPRRSGVDPEDHDTTSFLTTSHEEEYLKRLDAKLGDPLSGASEMPDHTPWTSMSARDIERQVELRNPLSVHNWLKKAGFVDELDKPDADGKKPLPKSDLHRLYARAAAEMPRQQDENMDDELGQSSASVRGRKSRGGSDGTHRGRGGPGSRGGRGKRKRDDGDSRPSGKKHKVSMGEAGDI